MKLRLLVIIFLALSGLVVPTAYAQSDKILKQDKSRFIAGSYILSRPGQVEINKFGSFPALQRYGVMTRAKQRSDWNKVYEMADGALRKEKLTPWAEFEFTINRGRALAALGMVAPAIADLQIAMRNTLATEEERERLVRQVSDLEQGLPVLERNWEPRLIKSKPAMVPKQAYKRGISGRCIMSYDIKDNGRTTNIQAVECTNKIFKGKSKIYISNRRYAPEYVDGEAIASTGHEKMVEILIKDRRGRLYPYKRD